LHIQQCCEIGKMKLLLSSTKLFPLHGFTFANPVYGELIFKR